MVVFMIFIILRSLHHLAIAYCSYHHGQTAKGWELFLPYSLKMMDCVVDKLPEIR